MCTVTFVSSDSKKIISSNRDEQILRQAIEPKTYFIGTKKITFPKDPKAGGTWFAVDELGNVLVLLNGANENHKRMLPYRKSRGIILLDILSAGSPMKMWEQIDLERIEPFTLVLFMQRELFQMSWDGINKDCILLDPNKNYIWSSSTLYSNEIRENRAQWFAKFMLDKSVASAEDMFAFHRYTENKNTQNGLIIDREGSLKTISITQCIVEKNQITLEHFDLIDHVSSETIFSLPQ